MALLLHTNISRFHKPEVHNTESYPIHRIFFVCLFFYLLCWVVFCTKSLRTIYAFIWTKYSPTLFLFIAGWIDCGKIRLQTSCRRGILLWHNLHSSCRNRGEEWETCGAKEDIQSGMKLYVVFFFAISQFIFHRFLLTAYFLISYYKMFVC